MPFRDGIFEQVFADPPHLFKKDNPPSVLKIKMERRSRGWLSNPAIIRYGYWNSREDWLNFREKTCEEFARILKDGGLLHYKISHGSGGSGLTRVDDVAIYTSRFDIETRKVDSHSTFGNLVYYFVFKKK